MIMMTVDSPCSILGQLRRILMREKSFLGLLSQTDFTNTVFHQEPSSPLTCLTRSVFPPGGTAPDLTRSWSDRVSSFVFESTLS